MASSNTPKNAAALAPVAATLQTNSGTVLTVGAGMEFATLADACRAAVDGDTIAVKAGTYLNDFVSVTSAVHIVAVGGVVNELATVPPPNDKALMTVDANLTIQGFTFTGGSDGNWDGNVAGIRLENGSLNMSYCYFHDMQEGLLAGADSVASVTIDHCEFAHNGTGDGYTHNLYVGAVASLTITNSYFHDAVVGHEIKSRAAVTTIANNVIADGANGTASYDIDLPNAGAARITGNIIEKGANASNRPVIHYGGETQYAWANNSLLVSGNTIVNDFGPLANVVANQSQINGLNVSANVTGNQLYGFDPAAAMYGQGTLTGNTILSSEPAVAAPATWSTMQTVALAAGPSLLTLVNGGHTVGGGAARLTVNDNFGSNTISGGAGGLVLNAQAGWDTVLTRAGATDTLNLVGRNCAVQSAGADHIVSTGLYEVVTVTGAASITSAGFSTYALNGAGETLTSSQSCVVNVGAACNARITDTGGDIRLGTASGAHLVVSDLAATPSGGAASSATIAGAVSGNIGNSGLICLTTGDSGAFVQAGTGAVSIAGGAGADTLTAGSGNDAFSLGGGADQMVFGSGCASVIGGSGSDTYHFHAGSAGHDTISGFKQGVDVLKFEGFSGNVIASGSVNAGNTVLTLTDGTVVTFAGVALPGYPGASGGGTQAPAPSTPGGQSRAPGGGTLLTTGGNAVSGGATLFTVTDQAGGNSIAGGAGGLCAVAGYNDVISTQAGSTNQLTLSRNDTVNGAGADQVTASGPADVLTEAGAASISLLGSANSVTGGAGLLSVKDAVGGDTIHGGTGGLNASLAGFYDSVTTASSSTDTVSLAGYSTLLSQGQDQIAVQGLYNQVTQTGTASIASASAFSTFDLEGTASLALTGGANVTVGHYAAATIGSASLGDVTVNKQAGGSLTLNDSLSGGISSVAIAGGGATVSAATGLYAGLRATVGGGTSVVAGSGALLLTSVAAQGGAADSITGGAGSLVVNAGAQGVSLVAGSGNVTLNGGSGDDQFTAGSGNAWLNLGGGHDSITLGAGSVTVQGGTGDTFFIPNDASGSLTIANWNATDSLAGPNHAAPAIASQMVSGGSLYLTMVSGAQIELVGVTHLT